MRAALAAAPKWPGYSKTIHYEITGARRINYQFNPAATGGARGDPHGVVKILTIDLGSHSPATTPGRNRRLAAVQARPARHPRRPCPGARSEQHGLGLSDRGRSNRRMRQMRVPVQSVLW